MTGRMLQGLEPIAKKGRAGRRVSLRRYELDAGAVLWSQRNSVSRLSTSRRACDRSIPVCQKK